MSFFYPTWTAGNKSEILRDNWRQTREDNETGQQPQPDSDTQQSLKH